MLNLKRPIFEDCADWYFKKITSPIRFYGTCLAPIHSFILCWNLPLSFRDEKFLFLLLRLSPLSLSQLWACTPPKQRPERVPSFSPAPCQLFSDCSQLPASRPLLWPQASGCRAGCGEHVTVCRPGLCHLALVIAAGIGPGCAPLSSHAHAGELHSPPEFVCQTSSLIITRLGSSDHVQTVSVNSLSF